MEMEMQYIGKISKLLIESNRKNKALDKSEIKDELSIPINKINDLLYKTQEYLSFLGLEMVGVSPTETVPIDESKKLFLRKLWIENDKKTKMMPNIENKKLFIIISAIQLENNRMHEEKISEIQKCKYFINTDLLQYMNTLKNEGYITSIKENDALFWSLGWRYYVEYSDCLDIFEYFNDNDQTKSAKNLIDTN